MILERFYENEKILHVGCEADRCYYIPRDINGNENRTLLNGVWQFAYFNNVAEAEDALDKNLEELNLNDIPVPSNWQDHGYDRHNYVNISYPFPYDPPYVPIENPCGLYVKKFTINNEELSREQYIVFEGVDSCFYIWINEQFVGYSQVSHSTSEFHISKFITEGENTVKVLVLKHCDGSYFEDQDKFRNSGIFRDVYLLNRPKDHIVDYTIRQIFPEDYNVEEKGVSLTIGVTASTNLMVRYELLDQDKNLVTSKDYCADKDINLSVTKPVLWNAEQPYLYELHLITKDEVIIQRIGLREIKAINGIVTLNGQKIKFKGVNHHDSDPVTGSYMTKEQVLIDLKLMKEHNINAIRTSHYPKPAWFLELCDTYGFYVMSESDIETHGCSRIYIYGDRNIGLLAQDPKFEYEIVDRVKRNVILHKNSTSVISWSFGNESGYGINFAKAAEWAKEYDPTRLLHYESGILAGETTEDTSMLDFVSRMYASVEFVDSYCQNPENTKPFVQCEFCHAMGNGPGDLEENVAQIYKYDNYCGGFIWEWCDHGVYQGVAEDGKEMYLYGGDFGDFPHDGNFCMDGLVYPDRRPHVGLLEYKNVIRPIRLVEHDNQTGSYTFENMLDFTDLSEYVNIYYEIKDDGNLISEGVIHNIEIAPHNRKTIQLDLPKNNQKNTYLRFIYTSKKDDLLTKSGHLLGFDQITLHEEYCIPESKVDTSNQIYIEDKKLEYFIQGENFEYTFSKVTGSFTKMSVNGEDILMKPMEYNVFRAYTDNDRRVLGDWEKAGYHNAYVRVYEANGECINQSEVIINCSMSMSAVSKGKFLTFDVTYKVASDGSIRITLKGERCTKLAYLPRLGLRLTLPDSYSQVEYFGYGPTESYCDKHRGAYVDKFSATVDELHEDYLMPQENGSHYGCAYAKINNEKNKIAVYSDEPFSFNASYYTAEQLNQTKHNFELEKSGSTILCIDYKHSGVGSSSCGPELMEKYRFDQKDILWNVGIFITSK